MAVCIGFPLELARSNFLDIYSLNILASAPERTNEKHYFLLVLFSCKIVEFNIVKVGIIYYDTSKQTVI